MAQQASQASIQFNTFQFFKTQTDRSRCFTRAIVMRVQKGAGVYVQVQKYGIEGLIVEDDQCLKITCDNDKAVLTLPNEQVEVKLFDHIEVEIVAKMVEFRRSVNLHFRGKIDASKENKVDKN